MNKKLLVVVLFTLSTLLVACSQSPSVEDVALTPSAEEIALTQVGNDFMQTWKDGRIEAAVELLAPDALEDPLWDAILSTPPFTPMEWSFVSINIDDNEGTLDGVVQTQGEGSKENRFRLTLIQVDGKWKVLHYSLNAD